MSLLLGIFFFLLGLAIGSFLNVVILRFNTGRGLNGRSFCFSCGKDLRWYELIPLFSFLFLRGKCKRCKSKISWQYPLVELLTGLIFLGIYIKYSYLLYIAPYAFTFILFYMFIIFSLLVVILVYDLHHKIIPDVLVYTVAALALIKLFINVPPFWYHGTLMDFLAGPILALPFALLWLVSRGTWMGLGDAKLALAMGWLLGVLDGISAIIWAFWIGAAISLIILALQKSLKGKNKYSLTMKSEIPFAPFLIIGLALVFFFGFKVIGVNIFM